MRKIKRANLLLNITFFKYFSFLNQCSSFIQYILHSISVFYQFITEFNIQIQANPRSCALTWNLEASKCSDYYYVLEVLRYKHLLSWESLYEITTRDNSASVRDLHMGKKYRLRITLSKIDGTRGHGFCSRTIIPMGKILDVILYTL